KDYASFDPWVIDDAGLDLFQWGRLLIGAEQFQSFVDGDHFLRLRRAPIHIEQLSATVSDLEEQCAASRTAVETGASRFRIICFKRPREVVMNHESDVGLVNFHIFRRSRSVGGRFGGAGRDYRLQLA